MTPDVAFWLAFMVVMVIVGVARSSSESAQANRVAKSFGDREIPSPQASVSLPARDLDSYPIPDTPKQAHSLFLMDYLDEVGAFSRRRITVHSVNAKYIRAYCHERQAFRTFRCDRVKAMVDMHTGELVGDLHAALALEKDALNLLFGKVQSEVLVLAYIARADGRMVAAERAIIAEHLVATHTGELIEAEDIDKRIKRTACTREECAGALKVIRSAAPEVRERVMQTAKAIVLADGKTQHSELEALQALAKFLDVKAA